MPTVCFIDHEGLERHVEGNCGDSVMETALNNAIPGIDADCGGSCACATCHVYVDEAYLTIVGGRNDLEESMLEVADGVEDNSRLACQMSITEDYDGLRVTTPESQHG